MDKTEPIKTFDEVFNEEFKKMKNTKILDLLNGKTIYSRIIRVQGIKTKYDLFSKTSDKLLIKQDEKYYLLDLNKNFYTLNEQLNKYKVSLLKAETFAKLYLNFVYCTDKNLVKRKTVKTYNVDIGEKDCGYEITENMFYTLYWVFQIPTTLNEKSFMDIHTKIKTENFINLSFDIHCDSSRKKEINTNLFFGFEIESDYTGNEENKIYKLMEHFGVMDSEHEFKELVIKGLGKISVSTNRYNTVSDDKALIKIYADGSVPYEFVTKPLQLFEIEDQLKPIYSGIKKIITPNYSSPNAGGHITLTRNQNMSLQFNGEVLHNLNTIFEAFYGQICIISTEYDFFRGCLFFMPRNATKTREKYSILRERYNADNLVVGIEARQFSSPSNEIEATNNAKIFLALYRLAEKFAFNGVVLHQSYKSNIETEIFSSIYNNRRFKNSKKGIYRNYEAEKIFLRLIEKEARKLNIFHVIKKRLYPSKKKNVDIKEKLSIDNKKKIINLIFNSRINNEPMKHTLELIKKEFGTDGEKVALLELNITEV